MPALPPWLPLDPSPPGRDEVVSTIVERLETPGALVVVTADPGMGVTTVLGAVAARTCGTLAVRAVRLVGSLDGPHVIHLVGHALGAPFPGDQSSVGENLRGAGPLLFILDDADVPDLGPFLERLIAVAPEARFLVAGRRVALGPPTVHLEGLTTDAFARVFPGLDCETLGGSPLLGLLVRDGGAPPHDPWRIIDTLPPLAGALAACPAGIPGPSPEGIPACLCLPSDPKVTILRRGVSERFFARRPPSPQPVAYLLHERATELLARGRGIVRVGTADPHHLPVLDYIASHHPDPFEATLAQAAMARIRISAGQAGLVRTERKAGGEGDDPIDGLRAWVEGDAQLADGEVQDAVVSWAIASTRLKRAHQDDLLTTLHLNCGEQLVARDEPKAALEHLREAIGLARVSGDRTTLSLALVGAAAAWMAQGDWMHADSLLEQARVLAADQPPDSPVHMDLRLVQISLAIERGSPEAADMLLDECRIPTDRSLQQANLARRRADHAIRQGDTEQATRLLDEATALYARAGERAALATCIRLQGDLAAITGDPPRADTLYSRATREHVRAGDLRGLARTLSHRALLEDELGDPDSAAHLRRLHGDVLRLLDD